MRFDRKMQEVPVTCLRGHAARFKYAHAVIFGSWRNSIECAFAKTEVFEGSEILRNGSSEFCGSIEVDARE